MILYGGPNRFNISKGIKKIGYDPLLQEAIREALIGFKFMVSKLSPPKYIFSELYLDLNSTRCGHFVDSPTE